MNVFKRILSLLLVFAMTAGFLPATARAAEEVTGDFVETIQQITWEDVVPEGYTIISTEAELRAMEGKPAGKFILMDDIQLESPVMLFSKDNPFTGVFEGNGHTITVNNSVGSGLTSLQHIGLFRFVSNARIADLKVSGNMTVTCDQANDENTLWPWHTGGIVGYATGDTTITNCVNAMRIEITEDTDHVLYRVGGIVGTFECETGQTGEVSYCNNLADLGVYGYSGGVVGYVDLNGKTALCSMYITHCRNSGNISNPDSGDYVGDSGGIVGYIVGRSTTHMEIYACMNTGNVTGYRAAGIISSDYGASSVTVVDAYSEVSSCANTGTIAGVFSAGGIVDRGNVQPTDCINTGTICSTGTEKQVGGISAYVGATRCVNAGTVDGAEVRGAISYCGMKDTKQDCDAQFEDCFWLNLGEEYTIYAVWYNGINRVDNLGGYTGRLSAEEMLLEESFTNFDFENTWTMVTEYGYPFPTALLDLKLDNKYYEKYIQNTYAFANASARYERIMGGSGDGSLAGLLGDTYDNSQADAVNGLWEKMQILEDLANYNIPEATGYDVMLADLLYGATGREAVAEHAAASFFGNLSQIITLCGTELSAVEVLTTEKALTDMADLPTMFDDAARVVVENAQKSILAKLPFETLNEILDGVGGVVGAAEAAAAGVDSKQKAIDFYVLCNAYADMVRSYSGILVEAAEKAKAVDSEEGELLYDATVQFSEKMTGYADGDVDALYQYLGGESSKVLATGGLNMLEAVLSVEAANPVLTYIKAVKSGYTAGMAVADVLTNMDDISYNGALLEMCELFAKGLYLEILERKETFARSKNYEDAVALNTATDLYLSVQILACEYAIRYRTAISSAKLATQSSKADELYDTLLLQIYKADLLKLQKEGYGVGVGEDGSIHGFIVNCPVTVVVTDSSGNEISRMKTGDIAVADGYDGTFMLLGREGEHKAGFFDPDEHTVTIIGEGDGTMDLVVYGARNGKLTFVDSYQQVPVSEGLTYVVGENGLDGEVDVPPTTRQEFRPALEGVTRIAGEDRIATSLGIADQLKDTLDAPKFDTMIVASALNFPDALTGSYLAAVKTAPILLTYEAAHPKIQAYIEANLAPGGTVYILGGESAVSAGFQNGLTEKGITVKRLAGSDRFGTNLEIMKEAGVSGDQPILIATAVNFADSLSASAAGLPMVLVYGSLREDQKAFLEGTSKNFVIIGGTSAVPADIENELKTIGTVNRLAGSSRYETSVMVAESFVPDPDAVVLAYARNFPDGLCGGPLAVALNAPLILTDNYDPSAADAYVDGLTAGIVVGGPGLISDDSTREIFDLASDTPILK